MKLKYLSDSPDLSESEIINLIKNNKEEIGAMGTTPRRSFQITDLVGSLCDLTSGSGDKGTPVVLIKNYFKKISDN